MHASPRSLRSQLLVLILLGVGLVWLGSAAWIYVAASDRSHADFDKDLAQSADLLLAFALHEYLENGGNVSALSLDRLDDPASSREQDLRYQIWSRDGHLLAHSATSSTDPLSPQDHGFRDVTLEGQSWVSYSRWSPQRQLRIVVAEPHAERTRIARRLGLSLLVPPLVAAPLLALLVIFGVWRGTRSIKATSRALRSREPWDPQPVDATALPAELHPLVEAFNQLLSRLQIAAEHERRFTADAAHELRTPLTAIRLQAQLALRATTPERSRMALRKLIEAVDRNTHTVEQLLTLARLDGDALSRTTREHFALERVVDETLDAFDAEARARGLQLRREVASVDVEGVPQAVYMLLRNLVENAVRYTPPGGHILVAARCDADTLRLDVLDNGPGIAEAQRTRLFERFARGDDVEAPLGSGLGLSIVKRVVDGLGGHIEIGPGLDGAGVGMHITLPA